MAASHSGSRRAARAEAGSGEGAGDGGGAVAAVHAYMSTGYRVDGWNTSARARVTGPIGEGAAPPEWPLEGDAVDEMAPELRLEGDAGGVGAAAPEAELEGAEGGVGGVAPERGLEGDADGVDDSAPELGLEGDEGGVEEEAPETELEGVADAAGARRRRHGVSPAEGEGGITWSCANGKQHSSK